jgi:hypothetical protein
VFRGEEFLLEQQGSHRVKASVLETIDARIPMANRRHRFCFVERAMCPPQPIADAVHGVRCHNSMPSRSTFVRKGMASYNGLFHSPFPRTIVERTGHSSSLNSSS